jgi:hypothetical protein
MIGAATIAATVQTMLTIEISIGADHRPQIWASRPGIATFSHVDLVLSAGLKQDAAQTTVSAACPDIIEFGRKTAGFYAT